MKVWFLSFSDGTNLGCCQVRASGITQAIQKAHKLNINPGGEVAAFELDAPEELDMNRLYTRAEMLDLGYVTAQL